MKEKANNSVDILNYAFETVDPPTTKVNNYKSIVEYGEDNLYPEFLGTLPMGSTTHGAFITIAIRATLGDGVKIVNKDTGEVDPIAQRFFDEWNEKEITSSQMERLAHDLVMFNGFYLESNWNNAKLLADKAKIEGTPVSDDTLSNQGAIFTHTPFHMWRAGIPDNSGEVNSYWSSTNWKKGYRQDKVEVSAFDPDNVVTKSDDGEIEENTTQILSIFVPNANSAVYPIPPYISGIYSILAEGELSKMNYNAIINGFTADGMLTIPFLQDQEKDKAKLEKQIRGNYTGANNKGKILLFQMDGGQDAIKPEFIPFNNPDNPDSRISLANDLAQRISSAWGSPSPALVGQIGNTGFASDAALLLTAYNTFQEQTIRYFQRILEKTIDKYILYYGGFRNHRAIIEPLDFTNILAVVQDETPSI